MTEEFGFGDDELSLLETLDHVLDSGLVIAGDVIISVADIDLIYLGLNVLLGSVETVEEVLGERARRELDARLPGGPLPTPREGDEEDVGKEEVEDAGRE
ncbi:MAG TPA: gas vesicle protein [Pyrinomonadaceae bacterium]|nr:gas vesicle protein [Pyrinomonadaceae bacterium]